MKKNYRIGEIAKIKNIDVQTLRYYDKMGILSPEVVDEQSNYRYYTEEQFIEVDRIKFCKILGLSLEEIKKFKQIKHVDEALKIFKMQNEQFEKKILQMQAVKRNIDFIIKMIEESIKNFDTIENVIEIKNCNSIYGVIGNCQTVNDWYEFEVKLHEITERYPNYSEIGHNQAMFFIQNEKCLYDDKDDYLEKIILPIDEQFINEPNVQEYTLGKCIVAYHKGDYKNIYNTFSKIKEYIRINKLKIRGDIIEISIISNFIVNNKEEWLEEIRVPLI